MERRYFSPAKINIGLRVVGKRPDGYHTLESVFQEISIGDEIVIRTIDRGIRIHSNDPTLPVDHRNSCHQAFELIRHLFQLQAGVEIELYKNIPQGSGLGGGSSNAATCLKAFNEIFKLGLSRTDLLKLAVQIGSDVPFFLFGKSAIVKGRGEVVIPVKFLSGYRIILVIPGKQISTAKIYKKFELGLTQWGGNIKFDAVVSDIRHLYELNGLFYNDLEGVVLGMLPEMGEIRERLSERGASYVSMSGSGSAVYGLFSDKQINLSPMRALFPHYRVYQAVPIL